MKEIAYITIIAGVYLGTSILALVLLLISTIIISKGQPQSNRNINLCIAAALLWPVTLPIQAVRIAFVFYKSRKKKDELVKEYSELTGTSIEESKEMIDTLTGQHKRK